MNDLSLLTVNPSGLKCISAILGILLAALALLLRLTVMAVVLISVSSLTACHVYVMIRFLSLSLSLMPSSWYPPLLPAIALSL